MSNLTSIELGCIGLTITGKTPSSNYPEDFGDKYMFITPSDEFDEKTIYKSKRYLSQIGLEKLKNKTLPPKSILVSCIGSAMGKIIMNHSIAISNQQINSIIVNNKYNPDYIYYNLKNNYKLLRNAASGSTALPMLNKTDFDKLIIKIHKNQTEQNSIASVLSSLDAKIELNNRINAELEAMAKTLYDYWFVQFEFPNEQGKPYKSSGGKMIWNEELKRDVPEGWEVKTIKDFAFTGSGSTPLKSKNEYYENGDIPWINSGEVNIPFIISANKYITELGLKNTSTKIFKKGTILIAMYGATAGKVSILDIDACTNQAICAINVNDNRYRNFLKLVLDDLYDYLINLSSGSARDNLSQDKLKNLQILIPNINILNEFDNIVDPIYLKILKNYRENQNLTTLRDWLLPMMMNGQVKMG